MNNEELYSGREQTLVKHLILQKYLERFAHIVGSFADAISYVDCFSGPWNVRSNNFEDSSFAIALNELRKARDTHAQAGRNLNLRCYFLEKDPQAYGRLKEFTDAITDAKVETRNGSLEESVSNIVDFVVRGGKKAFPFIFIDPSGWTGFEMDTIAPILRLNPGEVLINFMTGHIRRFLDSPNEQTRASFKRLFGSDEIFDRIKGLGQKDLEDAAVAEYARAVKRTGGFTHICTAIVLHPEIDRTHFNLVYATRNPKGVQVFKEAEKKAMSAQEEARAKAHQRRRESRTGQLDLLDSQAMHDPSYYNSLRERYLNKSRDLVFQRLKCHSRLLYDDAWALALSEPMTWESDLKEWIQEWQKAGLLELEGFQPRQRAPRLNEDNFLVWR